MPNAEGRCIVRQGSHSQRAKTVNSLEGGIYAYIVVSNVGNGCFACVARSAFYLGDQRGKIGLGSGLNINPLCVNGIVHPYAE